MVAGVEALYRWILAGCLMTGIFMVWNCSGFYRYLGIVVLAGFTYFITRG